ncbi:MAG: cellulose biosynthesis cyclic di-GMP-binding regulatory protein BcsB, partial [Anaerolineales bacterium]|nr:cellulose biosynthesis cyclic di-GMP-binding regulatory protein BcsB [Anaerolineales bacterium]
AEVVLNITTVFHDNNLPTDQLTGGLLQITFNGTLLDIIPIETNGTQTITLPLPLSAISSQGNNGRNVLSLDLKTNFGCNSTQDIIVGIQSTSYFKLPHQFTEPQLDLEQFPYPLQQNSFLPDEAVLITPDTPTASELEAIMNTAAGLGRLTRRTTINMMPYSALTDDLRAVNHLIFVGLPEDFPIMADIAFVDAAADESDGMLQIAASPWNPAKVVLYIGGATETGVNKAAKALGLGAIRTGSSKQTAVINDIYFELPAEQAATRIQSFGNLGYELTTLRGPDMASASFNFYIPPELKVNEEETASFTLLYNHSALLNYELSGINILLNGSPVKSLRIDENGLNLSHELVELPARLFQPGDNTLRFVSELAPIDACSGFKVEGSWFNIFPESSFNLPLIENLRDKAPAVILNQYPLPLAYDASLATTAFILPPNDTAAWFAALQIAYQLGDAVSGDLLDIQVALANDVPESIRTENNLVLIGRPSDLPILSELKLPVPVSLETNRFEHNRLPVEYDIPSDVSLGYLNILPSPWHIDYVVLSILGDSDEGIQNATANLLVNRRNLNGDFAVIESDQTFVTMTPLPKSSGGTSSASQTTDTAGLETATEGETAVSPPADTTASDTTATETNETPDPAATEQAQSAPENNPPQPTAATGQSSTNQNAAKRNLPMLPVAVLVVCTIALAIFGIIFFFTRKKRS